MLPGIVSAWIFFEGKVLLIFHKKLKKWLPIGGHIHEGESLQDALLREIKEETRLSVCLVQTTSFVERCTEYALPFRIASHSTDNGGGYLYEFVAVCEQNTIVPEVEEFEQYKWLTFDEFRSFTALTDDVRAVGLGAFLVYQNNV